MSINNFAIHVRTGTSDAALPIPTILKKKMVEAVEKLAQEHLAVYKIETSS